MAGAIFVLASAGAAGVAALDTTGNNIALEGTDALYDVTVDVLNACPTATAGGISYLGGGSPPGAAQMVSNFQQIAPMSRSLKTVELCSEQAVSSLYTAPCSAPCSGYLDMTSCTADAHCSWTNKCVNTQATCNAIAATSSQCGWDGGACVACTAFTDQTACLTAKVQGAAICAWTGSACTSGAINLSSHLAADLLLGLDSVALVANQANACTTAAQNGFGAASMTVTSDGSATGTAVTGCTGCGAGTATYTFVDAFDALKLLYFGLHHDDPTTPTYDCGSPARRTMIRQWRNVFSTDCPSGDAACPAGITHAWRHGDVSGTTEAFINILAGGDLPNKGATRVGIGTPVKITPALLRMNAFCNSSDANSTASPPPTTNGGAADFSDFDPVRTSCALNSGTIGDDVCGAFPTPASPIKFRGDLGVVLPVVLPDLTSVHAAEVYNAVNGTIQTCSGSCTPVNTIKSSQSTGILCPGGAPNIGGECLMPFLFSGGANDPRCYSTHTVKCSDSSGSPDGRAYNLPIVVPTAEVPLNQRGGNPFQWAVNTYLRPISSAFFRIHETHHTTASSGLCLETDAVSQIGCLVDSDPCSVGFSAREAAATFPGSSRVVNKALLVNGVSPFASGADLDANIEAMYTASGAVYPLTRRLYVATFYGFSQLKGGEAALASCFENDTLTSGAMTARHFVKIPAAGSKPAGVQCLDYDETKATTTQPPPPNTPGSAAEALAGCGFASNVDACAGVTITHP
jgi:hypothetical protein